MLLGITVLLCFVTGSGFPIVGGLIASYGCLYATKYVYDHVS